MPCLPSLSLCIKKDTNVKDCIDQTIDSIAFEPSPVTPKTVESKIGPALTLGGTLSCLHPLGPQSVAYEMRLQPDEKVQISFSLFHLILIAHLIRI